MRRIVIVGGGYAGVLAANRLARGSAAEIVLVDARPAFVERIRMHQRAAGQAVRDLPYARLLHPRIRFVQGAARAIDPEGRRVLLDGAELPFDRLLLALGARIDTDRVPGLRDHALAVGEPEQAARIAERLARGTGPIVVIGGGLTGIETVSELAAAWPRRTVQLVTSGRLGPDLAPSGAAHLRSALERLGVEVLEHERVIAIEPDRIVLTRGSLAATVIWAGPMRSPALAREAGLSVTEDGAVRVDAALRSVSHPWIVAAGDAAACFVRGQRLRRSCATAMPMGAHAADTIAADLAGERPRPFDFAYLVRNISIGRRDALLQWVDADDAPRSTTTGRAAAVGKELVCRFTVWSLHAQRVGLSYRWPRGPRMAALPEVA